MGCFALDGVDVVGAAPIQASREYSITLLTCALEVVDSVLGSQEVSYSLQYSKTLTYSCSHCSPTIRCSLPDYPKIVHFGSWRFFILKGVQKDEREMGKLPKLQKTMQILLLLWTMGVNVVEDLQRWYDAKTANGLASQSFLSSITEIPGDSTWERLDQPLSLHELTKALESLEKNKTPRNNGFPAQLYSALWDLIGQDLLEVYDSVLSVRLQNPANCARSAPGSVIHPDQTCAVPGRTISESLMLLRDAITYVQDNGMDACLISLDQEKTFGRISHMYMWDVLSKMGFGEGIRNWIRLLFAN
eukprot:g35822.t1